MKNISQAMRPEEAAQAFYGQNDAAFSEIVAKLAKADPRLIGVFHRTRQRFLDAQQN